MASENSAPVIIIPGFGQSKAALFENNAFQKQVWPLRFAPGEMAKKIIKPYLKTVLCRKDKGFTNTAYRMYNEAFEPFSYTPDGVLKHDLRAVENREPLERMPEKVNGYVHKLVPIRELEKKIGANRIYFFAYNSFSSPYETAEKLNAMIADVKKETGSNKVSLLAFSMGGAVVTAYFDVYGGKNDIKKVFFLNCSLGGSVLQADIMDNHIDKNEGYSLLGFISNGDTVKLFKRALAFTTWEVRYQLLYRSLDAVRDTVFLNSPGMWALMPTEQYPLLADRFIADAPHKKLREMTDRFYKAQKNVRALLSEQKEKGVEFHVCAGYGLHIMPLSASQELSTDGILPLPSTSLGAAAAFGGTPDTSNVLFPDTTYLFEGLAHSAGVRDERIQKLVAEQLG